MYKTTITLKQHTPIIHFQHDQEGATLRATELKPKLDKFIIEKLGNRWRQNKASWKVGGTKGMHDALDYKVKITQRGQRLFLENDYGRIDTPTFFANMDICEKDPKFKKPILYSCGKDNFTTEVQFTSYKKEIIEIIEENISQYFASTNFGMRQSKGYGSFYVSPESKVGYKQIEEILKAQNIIFWETKTNDYTDIFNQIDIIYRLLKSGYNYPDHPREDRGKPDKSRKGKYQIYEAGFLKLFFLAKQIGSEKREIKENLFYPQISKNANLKTNNYIRAILGITDSHDYRGEWDANNRKMVRYGKVKIKNKDIDRFKSPITFKVVDNKVFILVGDTALIEGKRFRFSKDDNNRTLSVPKGNFSLDTILAEFKNHFETQIKPTSSTLEAVKNNNNRKPPRAFNVYLDVIKSVDLKVLK